MTSTSTSELPRVVVTGAGQGIGAAIALRFAREPGASLELVGRNEPKLERVAAEARALGAGATAHPCDLTDDAAVAVLAARMLAGPAPAVLVNNAGEYRPSSVLETDGTAFRRQIEDNLTSAFLLTRALLPAMLERRHAHVFFLASVASLAAYPGALSYTAAKHGLLGLARSVRAETLDTGVRVTTVLAGGTWTPSWEGSGVSPERLMSAEDVAEALHAAWRLSPRTVVEEILLRPQRGEV